MSSKAPTPFPLCSDKVLFTFIDVHLDTIAALATQLYIAHPPPLGGTVWEFHFEYETMIAFLLLSNIVAMCLAEPSKLILGKLHILLFCP